MTNGWDASASLTDEEWDTAIEKYRDMLDKQPVPQENRYFEVGGVLYGPGLEPMEPHMRTALLEMLNE